MSTEEVSHRLTQILQGIILNEEPNTIQGFVQNFIEDFVPDQDYIKTITSDVNNYEKILTHKIGDLAKSFALSLMLIIFVMTICVHLPQYLQEYLQRVYPLFWNKSVRKLHSTL